MSNLIMEALAFNHGRAAGINVEESNNTADNYVESAIVSLASAKRENPDCEVSLYCNDPLSGCYVDIAKRLGIGIKAVPFDNYVFDSKLPWHLAYYKLCALKYAVDEGYEAICLLDTDTWSTGSVSELLDCRGGSS